MAKSFVWTAILPVSVLVLCLGGCKSFPLAADNSCEKVSADCIKGCKHATGLQEKQLDYNDRELCAEACSREYEKCSQGFENDN